VLISKEILSSSNANIALSICKFKILKNDKGRYQAPVSLGKNRKAISELDAEKKRSHSAIGI
jgi:hypothetical protein